MAVKIPNFHEAIGPMVIGFGLCCVVFGILSQQTVTYYQRYFHDRLRYKFLVGLLFYFKSAVASPHVTTSAGWDSLVGCL